MTPDVLEMARVCVCACVQEYKRKQLEEQRQSERLQRQLQQEHAYLVSLQQQQQQQQEKKPLYHYSKNLDNNKPAWAREVHEHAPLHAHSDAARQKKSHAIVIQRIMQNWNVAALPLAVTKH